MPTNRLEKFEIGTVKRSEIHGAPYNPRKISESAATKVRKSLRDFGSLRPIVWNKTTGNIVGGHQRIDAMDTILKKPDYKLTVAIVEMSLEEEVKANIVLNNPAVMGEWDTDKLAEVRIDFPDIDFDKDLGFDKYDLDMIFADTQLEGDVFTAFEQQAEVKTEVDRLREIDKLKEAKKKHRAEVTAADKEGGTHEVEGDDYMVTFVFPNNSEKWDFMRLIKEKTGERYVKHTKLYDIQEGKLKAFGKNGKKETTSKNSGKETKKEAQKET